MKRWVYFSFFGLVLIGAPNTVFAGPLNGEYIIQSSATQLGPNSWSFVYDVTNVNQSVTGPSGFDVLAIQIPASATISNIIVPPPYQSGMGDYWSWVTYTDTEYFYHEPASLLLPGYVWFEMYGAGFYSAYPSGTTVELSFQADGVNAGTTTDVALTLWDYSPGPSQFSPWVAPTGIWYSTYTTGLLGPIDENPVTEPGSLTLLGMGAVGALGFARRRRKQKV